ncbi:MAG: hypothetical protein WD557_05755 [Dehalococcoidia bacterium]
MAIDAPDGRQGDPRCIFCSALNEGWAVGRDYVWLTVCTKCLYYLFALRHWLGDQQLWHVGGPSQEEIIRARGDGSRALANWIVEHGEQFAAVDAVATLLKDNAPGVEP